MQHILEREPRRDESEQMCYMVQGNDSLKVNSDIHLDNSASFSYDDNMDVHAINEELTQLSRWVFEFISKESFPWTM